MTADLDKPFHIEPEPAKLLSGRQELTLLREAYQRRPETPLLRRKLVTALLAQDAFDAVIELLGAEPELDVAESAVLISAHLARETAADNDRVGAIVERIVPMIDDAPIRAQFLAQQAKACRRLGRLDAAQRLLADALALDPANMDACMRMASIGFAADDTDAVTGIVDTLVARGVSHAFIHSSRAIVHARAGRIASAQTAVGFDDFHYAARLVPPPGMPDLAAFNAALATELLNHPDHRYDRYGTAGEKTWRIDKPASGCAPMVDLLLAQIMRTAKRHVAGLTGSDHPWIAARPERAILNCWCVITDGAGHETWHIHPSAWMSGVYYIQIPTVVLSGEGPAGCIAFGLPEEEAGVEAATAYGIRLVRPEAGMMMLFPSHSYHRTFPHGSAERRLCLAFDICPV